MKQLLVILATFIVAIGTSMVLDTPFIYNSIIRYVIVLCFIVLEFYIGFSFLKSISK